MAVVGGTIGRWERATTALASSAFAVSPVWLVLLPLLIVFTLTPATGDFSHIDPLTNNVTGWHLAMTGSPALPGYEEATDAAYYQNVGWFVDSPRGPISQYPPGAALLSAPLYRLWDRELETYEVIGSNRPDAAPIEIGIPPRAPGRLTAAISTAIAMALVAAAVHLAGATRMEAMIVGLVGGLATSMWSVASTDLWQHGPASMWVALGVFLAARSRHLWAGLAFGAAILTRPHLAIIALAVGVAISLADRNIRPALRIGFGSLAGLVALLSYNFWVWGDLTLTGGYGGEPTSQLFDVNLMGFGSNILGGMFDMDRGVLILSPFLLILIPGVRTAWRNAPAWAKGAAVGGVIYLLVQFKANRFSGGAGFTGYRYPLEALTAGAVLLFFAYRTWVKSRPMAQALLWLGVGAATIFQVI